MANSQDSETDWGRWLHAGYAVIALVVAAPWVGWTLTLLIAAGGVCALVIRAVHNRS